MASVGGFREIPLSAASGRRNNRVDETTESQNEERLHETSDQKEKR